MDLFVCAVACLLAWDVICQLQLSDYRVWQPFLVYCLSQRPSLDPIRTDHLKDMTTYHAAITHNDELDMMDTIISSYLEGTTLVSRPKSNSVEESLSTAPRYVQ